MELMLKGLCCSCFAQWFAPLTRSDSLSARRVSNCLVRGLWDYFGLFRGHNPNYRNCIMSPESPPCTARPNGCEHSRFTAAAFGYDPFNDFTRLPIWSIPSNVLGSFSGSASIPLNIRLSNFSRAELSCFFILTEYSA